MRFREKGLLFHKEFHKDHHIQILDRKENSLQVERKFIRYCDERYLSFNYEN